MRVARALLLCPAASTLPCTCLVYMAPAHTVRSFEEFKAFYNAAKEDAAGRRKKGPQSKTSNGLDDDTEVLMWSHWLGLFIDDS